MLVKPHGVFLVIGIFLSVIVLNFRNLKPLIKPLAIYLGVSFGLRLIIGFLAAGTAGLGLFTGYAEDGAVSALTGSVAEAAANELRLNLAIEYGVFALLAFIAGLLILSPGLFGALVQTENGKFFGSTIGRQKSFLYFSILVFLSQAAAFTLFIFYAASGGESFANRVVFRYVEFLIPIIAIAILANYLREKTKFKINVVSFVFLALTVAAIAYSVTVFGDGINIRYADSGFTFLFSDNQILSIAIVLLVVVSMLQFLGVETVIRRATYISFLVLFPALGIYTNLILSQTTQTLAPLDEGAAALKMAYELDPVETVYVVAPSKGEAQYLQMKSGVVDSEYLVSNSAGVGGLPIEATEALVLSVGSIEFFESDNGYRQSGNNYSLERLTEREVHYFGKKMIDSPISSVSGFVNTNSRFAWFDNENPSIRFDSSLSDYRSVSLTVMVADTLTGGNITATAGDSSFEFAIPNVSGQLFRVNIELDGSQTGSVLEFSSEDRSLIHGLGIQSVELNR